MLNAVIGQYIYNWSESDLHLDKWICHILLQRHLRLAEQRY